MQTKHLFSAQAVTMDVSNGEGRIEVENEAHHESTTPRASVSSTAIHAPPVVPLGYAQQVTGDPPIADALAEAKPAAGTQRAALSGHDAYNSSLSLQETLDRIRGYATELLYRRLSLAGGLEDRKEL